MAGEYDDEEDYGAPSGGGGALAMLQLGNQTTTPEALSYARKILEKSTQPGEDPAETDYIKRVQSNADIARNALRAARERLSAQEFGNKEAWLAAAAGFGAPTKTGAFGESIGRVAGNLIEPTRRKREFNQGKEKSLLDLDLGLAGVDDTLLKSQLELLKLKQQTQGRMSVEALKTMGRKVGEDGKTPQMARRAVDREYAKDYVDYIQTGASDAAKALEELGSARDRLRGYAIDPESGKKVSVRGASDNLTGPVVGTMSNLPWIGKTVQDVFYPDSSDVQETVEYTVQRSLRPILGSQFTKEEGERLIARVYNPRLDEKVNAERLDRLLKQLERANQAKKAAADYFEEHGTLGPSASDPRGFQGKKSWSINDFMPKDEPTARKKPRAAPSKNDDSYDPWDGGVIQYEDLVPAGEEFLEGGEVDGYAEGGGVNGRVDHEMPDGRIISAPPQVPYEQVKKRYEAMTGQVFEDEQTGAPDGEINQEAIDSVTPGMDFDAETTIGLGGSALGHGLLGAAGGRYGSKLGYGLADLVPGHKTSDAEGRVLQGLENEGLTPTEWTRLVSQAQKMGVPATGMDLGGVELRALGEASMNPENKETRDLYATMRDRQAGARGRVESRINQSLKPDDYFGQMKKLKSDLKSNSSPLYKDLYAKFPSLKSPALMQLMGTPSGKRAVKEAVKAIQDRPGASLGKTDATGMVTKPSLEFLDEVKNAYDDMITDEEMSGGVYKATKRGKRWRDLRNALRNEVDTLTTDPKTGVSAYKEARSQYAGDLETIDALRFGREDFMKMPAAEVADTIKDMNFSERDALRSGVAQSLFEKIGKVGHRVSPAEKVIDTPDLNEKLKLLFDKPNEFKIFKEAMDLESKMFEESQSTIRRGRSALSSTRDPKSNILRRTVKKAPTLGIFSPTQWAIRWLRRSEPIGKKEAGEIVRILKTSDPKDLKKLEARLTPKFGRELARKKRTGKAAMAGAALGAAFPFAKDYFNGDDEPPADEETGMAEGGQVDDPVWNHITQQVLNGSRFGADDIVSPLTRRMGR